MTKLDNSDIMEIVFQVAESQDLYYKDFSPLCHYTKGIGVNGILQSKYLRANHVSNLNDLSEIIRAYKIFFEIFENIKSENEIISKLIENIKVELLIKIKQKEYPEIFIVSFSKNIDDLFLWRSYTSFNDAYALIFTKAFIAEYGANEGAELLHCIYKESEQYLILNQVTNLFITKIENIQESELTLIKEKFFQLIHIFVPFIKNPQFEAENEVRLVLRNPHNHDSENRIIMGLNSNYFYKYVNLPIFRNLPNVEYEHAIEEIIVGPNSRSSDENHIFKKNLDALINQNIGSILKGIRDTKFNTLKF
ncbi:DUF2971 domain-containing protein [Leptospira mtsangambouensis]|uniref:DUF2971 domain-containing protein n=1 Tax=Leptospira mtsangambouensis TaxID=2484912 RepID=A0ABY2NZT0_9LEPT|nr:DUF2971 domain-containing protein [Leptospira mtsangambouensis]TGM74290.1 DUF2971 domain-containing protein [Leptospira mtsangambouensis]